MPRPKYRMFSPENKPSPMDRLINEFGLFVSEFALRTEIKNPEKVYNQLLYMRREHVKDEVSRAVFNALTALENADYLAIFYCLDDNVEAFKLRHQGADADIKRAVFYPLALATESPQMIEFLSSIKPQSTATLLDELEIAIALFNKRYKASKKNACEHFDQLLINTFKQIGKDEYPEVILVIGHTAALYNNLHAWKHFIELLNKNKLLVTPEVAEQLLIKSANSGSVFMCQNAFLVWERTHTRYVELNQIPTLPAKIPSLLKKSLFAAAALSGNVEMFNYLRTKLEINTPTDKQAVLFAWIDLGLPPAPINIDGIEPQLLTNHAVMCNLATLKKVTAILPFTTYTFTGKTLELVFLSADLELIHFVVAQCHGLFPVTDQLLKNAVASGNPNVLLKAIEFLEERQGHFSFESLCEKDGESSQITWPATPEMNACIKSLAEEYQFPLPPIK